MLGTPQYMSPEQIGASRGRRTSRIFAFGCVLYEMVTGKRAFEGKTKASVIGAILAAEPPAMSQSNQSLRERWNAWSRGASRRTQRIATSRLRDVVLDLRSLDAVPEAASKQRHSWLPWAVSAVLATSLAVTAFLWLRAPVPEVRSTQFLLHPPGATRFTSSLGATAVSPDGRYLVFGAATQPERRLCGCARSTRSAHGLCKARRVATSRSGPRTASRSLSMPAES